MHNASNGSEEQRGFTVNRWYTRASTASVSLFFFFFAQLDAENVQSGDANQHTHAKIFHYCVKVMLTGCLLQTGSDIERH